MRKWRKFGSAWSAVPEMGAAKDVVGSRGIYGDGHREENDVRGLQDGSAYHVIEKNSAFVNLRTTLDKDDEVNLRKRDSD